MFVDELELLVRGGRGGNGVVSFRREKYVPKGGPDGGDGGHGGNVFLSADPSKHSFLDLRYHRMIKATDGAHGRGKNQHGARGADLLVPVPLGTIVRDEEGAVLADLTAPGSKALVARGGAGGKGNARFATARRRAPRLADKGLPGDEKKIFLELKLMAQVGLVGFPNAGKSTLLGRISAAKPKIASYPFTTLTPNLGMVETGDGGSFIIADLPGLIEGAHEGAGLGHRFLRHVERNVILLLLIDLSVDAQPPATEAYRLLKKELIAFNPVLEQYPRLVVGSKMDLTGAAEQLELLRRAVAEEDDGDTLALAISAVTGEGIDRLIGYLHDRVRELADREDRIMVSDEIVSTVKMEEDTLIIKKEGELFLVGGSAIERMAAKTDFDNEDALLRFQHYCRRSGLDRKLKNMGIEEGDAVRIGETEFYYYE